MRSSTESPHGWPEKGLQAQRPSNASTTGSVTLCRRQGGAGRSNSNVRLWPTCCVDNAFTSRREAWFSLGRRTLAHTAGASKMVKLSDAVSSSRRKSRKVLLQQFANCSTSRIINMLLLCTVLNRPQLFTLYTLCTQNHFTATSVTRHKIMSSHLNKELREKYQVCLQMS